MGMYGLMLMVSLVLFMDLGYQYLVSMAMFFVDLET